MPPPSPPARALDRARRKLKIRPFQAVALTARHRQPAVAESPLAAILLARANLVRCWTIDPQIAADVGTQALSWLLPTDDPTVAQLANSESARRALGAAMATVAPAPTAVAQNPTPIQPDIALHPDITAVEPDSAAISHDPAAIDPTSAAIDSAPIDVDPHPIAAATVPVSVALPVAPRLPDHGWGIQHLEDAPR